MLFSVPDNHQKIAPTLGDLDLIYYMIPFVIVQSLNKLLRYQMNDMLQHYEQVLFNSI